METTLGIETWGTRTAPSKLEIITAISRNTGSKSLDIGVLPVTDLSKILEVSKKQLTLNTGMPSGRRKQPYLNPLTKLFPTVKNLNKLTVAALQELLGAFIHE